MKKEPAIRGGGRNADIFGALEAATALDWASATRIIYYVGDAPCHGERFHTGPPKAFSDHAGQSLIAGMATDR